MSASSRQPDHAGTPGAVLAYDLETIAPPMPDGSFPPWPTHVPVAAGFAEARLRGGEWVFDIAALVVSGDTQEADLILEADRRMATAQVVTSYNGRQFDALVLRIAAQRARIWNVKAIADHAAANRFGGEHADLADLQQPRPQGVACGDRRADRRADQDRYRRRRCRGIVGAG